MQYASRAIKLQLKAIERAAVTVDEQKEVAYWKNWFEAGLRKFSYEDTALPRTLRQTIKLWVQAAPKEAEFFQAKIDEAIAGWKAIEAAAVEPQAVNFATAKAKEASK